VLRLSWDAKATVKIGDFSRGGKNRLERKAADHDFQPEGILNPFGILLPQWDDLHLYFTASPVTSDFIVDVLERWWRKKPQAVPACGNVGDQPRQRPRDSQPTHAVLETDGAVCAGTGIADSVGVLSAVPQQIQRDRTLLGRLEQHWDGEMLDDADAVLGFARTMTWNGRMPKIEWYTNPT